MVNNIGFEDSISSVGPDIQTFVLAARCLAKVGSKTAEALLSKWPD